MIPDFTMVSLHAEPHEVVIPPNGERARWADQVMADMTSIFLSVPIVLDKLVKNGRSRPIRGSLMRGRAWRRTCGAPTRRCTPASRGRFASTPATPQPRRATTSTAATWRPARRASVWPST